MANEYATVNDRKYRHEQTLNIPHRIPNEMPNNKPNITMKKITPKKGSAPKVFIGAIFALSLLFLVIYGKVETSTIYKEVSEANRQLEELQSEKNRMQVEIEAEMSLKNVEDYAENVLGLKKLDKSQIEYIQIQTDDVVEIPEEEENIFIKIKNTFNEFMEYILG
ncbi:MAG: hypothetical protein GX365_04740 [Clostridiales bacterium]|nr:hypothetical protein [Clostridiales bacterium]